MSETTDDDEIGDSYNRPPGGEVDGHAAVGFVCGQRHADGSAPEWVEVVARRDGRRRYLTVLRTSGRAESTDGPSVQWAHETDDPSETRTVITDALLAARPRDS